MTATSHDAKVAAARLIEFLETNEPPEGLFAPDVFVDLSLPQWRLQADTSADAVAIRTGGHPWVGQVHVERLDQTDSGFVLEFEERWTDDDGQHWYCREMIRADVVDDTIVDMAVYCTGDWDEATQREHAAAVRLLRS
jgi:hypothetical protein